LTCSTKAAYRKQDCNTIYIEKSGWIRAKCSGLLHDHWQLVKGTVLAITDPFGKFERKIKSPNDGYIINANLSSIVYQGDAIYHISKTLENKS
jgi:predicted deacylase